MYCDVLGINARKIEAKFVFFSFLANAPEQINKQTANLRKSEHKTFITVEGFYPSACCVHPSTSGSGLTPASRTLFATSAWFRISKRDAG